MVEIGGPDVLTYREMMQAYAEVAGLPRRVIVPVPVLTPRLSSLWVGLVTPLPADLARPLVESLINEVVVTRPPDRASVVDQPPISFRRAVELGLQRSLGLPGRHPLVRRHAARAQPRPIRCRPTPTGPAAASSSTSRRSTAPAPTRTPSTPTVAGIGGDRGLVRHAVPVAASGAGSTSWSAGSACGAAGATPTTSWVGDAVDFWRVEAVEPDALVRLRAEMRLPGEAWLEWRIVPGPDGGSEL